jgi:predicted Zn-dependent protease
MLFDLRSRGRRRTVQAVYLGLAIILGGGLVLFGVGTGTGGGGLLNAFNGGSSNQGQVVSSQEKDALKATQQRPTDPSAWASLVQARWTAAGQGSNYNPQTLQYTSSGKDELKRMTQAWQRYLQLMPNPDPTVAILAARAYAQLGDYANAANAWELQVNANPGQPKTYYCLAASAYAAGQTRKGDLAAAKTVSLLPKSVGASTKTALASAKSSPQTAQQLAQQNC